MKRSSGSQTSGAGLGPRGDAATWLSFGVIAGIALALADARHRRIAHATAPVAGGVGMQDAADLKLRGWRTVLAASFQHFNQDAIPATAAGITFYALLAIFPGMAAFVSLYGLVADVKAALAQLNALRRILPGGAMEVLRDQLMRLAMADHGALGLTFAIALAVSIWSANAGMKALINGLNVAYETRETRGFVWLTLLSLGLTVGGLVLAVLSVAVIVDVDPFLQRLGLGSFETLALLRWPALLIALVFLLSVLYRFGPSRRGAQWRWITPGGAFAVLAWLGMSALFTAYVANFGHYDKTYGSLGAIVGFLTWIWLSLMVVLYGAELNAQIERERARER